MLKVEFSEEFIQSLTNKIKNQLVPVLVQELKQQELPPLLTRKQFMELVGISPGKCNELFHRKDFPVTRQLGHPRVPTKKFFEWLNEDIDNRKDLGLNYPYQAI